MPPNSEEQELASTNPEIRQAVALLVRKVAREKNLPDGAADDLQQAVSIKLFSLTEARLEAIENIDAYLATVVRNEANRLLQKIAQPEVPLDNINYSDHLEAQRRMESAILLKQIWKMVDPEERRLFRMMLFDYNEKEMALSLNISHDAARKRVSRFRQRLQELILKHSSPPTSTH